MARNRAFLGCLLCAVASASIAAPVAVAGPGLPSDWQRGANVTSWSPSGYLSTTSDSALADLRATGATNAAIVVTWYMDTPTSSIVAPVDNKTPSDAAVEHAIATAKSLGLKVTLKPHVDVWDGTFRGEIAPASRDAWYASYRAMISHYADLAASTGVDMLAVGTELTSMAGDESQWRDIIRDVRSRFAGALTFDANWVAGAQQIRFWDALDYIGVDGYMPLSSGDPNPTVDDLARAWQQRGYVPSSPSCSGGTSVR